MADNRAALDSLFSRFVFFSTDAPHRGVAVTVTGHASPTGSSGRNWQLSRNRARAVSDYLRAKFDLPDSTVNLKTGGIDWERLATLVEKDTTIPGQKEVLDVLRHTPVWIFDEKGDIVSGRKKQLMDLRYGRVYRLLEKRYFAELRNAVVEIDYGEPVRREAEHSQEKDTVGVFGQQERVQEKDTVGVFGQQDGVPEREETDCRIVAPSDRVEATPNPAEYDPLHRLAIKTNLLYDAALMPSLEVEYRISDRWTVGLEGGMAWWKNNGRHKFYQLASISPEGRYWFKTRKPWHGHYVGLFGGFSWYDLENGKRGYRGEGLMTGLSYGYVFPVSRSLSFEAGIGVGFLHTWYEEYLPIDGCYVYQQSSKMNYFGPLKVKFSLVWRLWDTGKKKGGDR